MNRIVKNLFLCLTFCMWARTIVVMAQASRDDYEHFAVNNGLPVGTTYNVLSAKDGFLWVATSAGVSRFDGKSFFNYTTRDGLNDNEILNLYQDKKDRIWFISFSKKLCYYKNGHFYTEANDTLLARIGRHTWFNYPVEDISGNIYIEVRSTVDDYFMPTTQVMRIGNDNSLRVYNLLPILRHDEGISTLYRSPNQKRIYCLTNRNRIIRLSEKAPTSKDFLCHEIAIRDSIIRWYPNFNHPELLVGIGKKGIYKMVDTVPGLIVPDYPTQHLAPFDIRMDRYANLWISDMKTNLVLIRYDNGRYDRSTPILNELFAVPGWDQEDNVWFCTGNHGLYKIPYAKLAPDSALFFHPHLLQKNILSAYTDNEGTLWLGYSNGYVTQVSGTSIIHHNLNHGSRRYNRVVQIVSDKQGDMWFATDETCVLMKRKGRARFAPPTYTVNADGSFFLCALKGIAFDKQDNAYVTGPTGQLHVVKPGISKGFVFTGRGGNRRHYSSFFDSQGKWYISTMYGLRVIDKQDTLNLGVQNPELGLKIQYFAEDRSGTVFLASYSHGLFALRNNRVVARLTYGNGLSGIICRKVYVRNNQVYIVTNGGITIANFRDTSFVVTRNVGLADGLPSLDVNDITFLGNIMYAATSEGIAALNTAMPTPRQWAPPPTLHLISFRVNDNSFPLNGQIVFPYAQQRIRIDFIAPVMDRPEMVTYRYRMGGNNTVWNITSTSQLEFTDLPYGEFSMEIGAKKYNSAWSPSRRIVFTITPPFYSTWWFRLLSIACSGFSLYLLIRYFLTKRFREQLATLKQKEAIEKERNRIAADIHDDLGADLTNIVIQARILKDNAHHNEPVAGIIDKIEQSSNDAITKMNEVVWALNKSDETLHNLAAYLRAYVARIVEENELQATIGFDDGVYINLPVKAEVSRNIFLILKEALRNVVQHAEARQVKVYFSLQKDRILVLEIEDDGKGLDSSLQNSGNGIYNLRKRTMELGGSFSIVSLPGAGCRIQVTIPF